ncbi:uncharacterized protein LOC129598984 isoform X2 [Paramacrobiotus metropolitanus]|nr:uncharacterized protein LOC129598984 isoform X2 [Paramacrobiotus metropolitanus]
MFVSVDTSEPFAGIINARGHRDSCFQLGDGKSRQTVLIVPLLNTPNDPIYCAQQRDIATGDYKVVIEVHAHKMLELENDKMFIISCSQNGLLANGSVRLSLLQRGEEVANNRLVQGEQYLLSVVYSNATIRNQQLDVTNCVAFGRSNATQQLSDNRGCPVDNSPLGKFDANDTAAVAVVSKMFKFQDSTQMHIQCDVGFCRVPCQKPLCPGEAGYNPNAESMLKIPRSDVSTQGLAGATFTVVEPGSTDGAVAVSATANQCGYGEWVLALCITFGILFLIMLIVNIIMCSAVSCNCTRKDRTDEIHAEPASAWGEYDTVKNVWSHTSGMSGAGSIPGDRHSVHSIPVNGLVGQSQYQPRGPSPYYQPPPPLGRPLQLHDPALEREELSLRERSMHPGYGDHYAMVHRNGSSTKY